MSSNINMKGYVAPLPFRSKEGHVMLVVDSKEYTIIPKGAGVDLDDHLGAFVQVEGVLNIIENSEKVFVRKYTVLDDDLWDE